jgi:hypothetical protein
LFGQTPLQLDDEKSSVDGLQSITKNSFVPTLTGTVCTLKKKSDRKKRHSPTSGTVPTQLMRGLRYRNVPEQATVKEGKQLLNLHFLLIFPNITQYQNTLSIK